MEPSMTKLTDTQLVILSAANQRANGNLLPLPKSLKLNKATAGMVLQSLLKAKLANEQPAEPGEVAWRDDDEGKFTLKISDRALKRLDGPAGAAPERSVPAASKKTTKLQQSPPKVKEAKAATAAKPAAASGTKIGGLITLLRGKTGATIPEAMEATGWQAHSVRGAISGTLKKKQGLTVTSDVEGARGRVYRIVVSR
jgi:hypothetical protein